LIDDLYLQKSKYYYSLGRAHPWVNEVPPQVVDTEKYEIISRQDALLLKRIEGTSLSFVIPRVDYEQGVVYDIYDDNISMEGKNFYVINTDFNVYKCLHNNAGRPSTIQPFGTSRDAISYDDGYVWKFIYNIPPALRNRFLTNDYIPVYNAITERYYSRGSINSVIINSGGGGYSDVATTISVVGDGFLEFDPFKITTFLINDVGSGYSTIPTIKTEDIFLNNTQFLPNSDVIQGQVIRVSDTSGIRYYLVESAGELNTIPPNHYYGVANNGTASLRHVGTEPKITATINDSIIGSVFISDPGFGYTSTPTVSKASPGSGAVFTVELTSGGVSKINVVNGGIGYTNTTMTIDPPIATSIPFTANAVVALNAVILSGDYFYLVTQAGQLGASAPVHTTGIAVNGTTVLTVIAKQAKAQAVIGVINTISTFLDINSVNVLNRGTGYTTASVVFSGGNPTFPAVANAVVADGKVIRIVVTYPGYGYESEPTVTILGDGAGATAYVVSQYGYGYRKRPRLVFTPPNDLNGINATGDTIVEKTNAKLEAVIIGGVVRGINIIDAGVGYTTARLTVLGDGTGASLSALFASGDLTTIQSQSELFAIDGTMSSVVVESGGANLQYLLLSIDGDGTGAELEPVIVDGVLEQVRVISAGQNYTYANINMDFNPSATAPNLRAVLSPIKGHGSNHHKEFDAKSVALTRSFAGEINNG
jgi:hypothetical protein